MPDIMRFLKQWDINRILLFQSGVDTQGNKLMPRHYAKGKTNVKSSKCRKML